MGDLAYYCSSNRITTPRRELIDVSELLFLTMSFLICYHTDNVANINSLTSQNVALNIGNIGWY